MIKYYMALLVAGLLPLWALAQNVFPSSGNVGIGTTDPQFLLHISTNVTTGFAVQNTVPLSGYSGAFLRLYNSGTPTAANQGLGGLLWGTNPSQGSYSVGAQLVASTEGPWTIGSSQPTYMRFLTTPSSAASLAERMRISAEGNVGINITNPTQRLTVAGNIMFGINNQFGIVLTDNFTYDSKGQPNYGMQWTWDSWSTSGPTLWAAAYGGMKFFTQSQPRLIITGNGNVGIGVTDTKGYKLAVAGSMIAEKVKVKLQTGWPDFVFAPDYQLPPLAELENYVKTHQHLPDIPTATEIEKDGLDLGEMNKKLLQKVEELTLYLIQVGKQNQELKAEIEMLKSRIK